ncbi:hypothetical protein P3T76_015338 [Phytophthora citrophthora]|uniref:Uncharacterized protein n=1 Tax=Phytophthora citrophthora TaxID=4793 RepID=A0AAD9LAD9_9STRA|nr:hypothetical protein P3T76_015338 [Phytophthora citrophthora]
MVDNSEEPSRAHATSALPVETCNELAGNEHTDTSEAALRTDNASIIAVEVVLTQSRMTTAPFRTYCESAA